MSEINQDSQQNMISEKEPRMDKSNVRLNTVMKNSGTPFFEINVPNVSVNFVEGTKII